MQPPKYQLSPQSPHLKGRPIYEALSTLRYSRLRCAQPPLTAAMLGLCLFSQASYGVKLLPSYLVTALTVACALFMENLDSTVISTSLPAIAKDLHEDPISLKLALTSYLISLAIFIPAFTAARSPIL